MRGRHEALANCGAYGSKTIDTSVTMRSLAFLSKQKNAVTVFVRDGRGRPGYLIYHPKTDQWFSSQRVAAKMFDVSEKRLSNHLNGKTADIDGHKFERIHFS